MSTCAKCNASLDDYFDPEKKLTECPVVVFCLQRQLANLRSLLRSVTGNLEAAAELLALDTKITIDEMRAAAREIVRGLTDEERRVLAAGEWEEDDPDVIDRLVERGLLRLTHRDETGENYLPTRAGALLLSLTKEKQ